MRSVPLLTLSVLVILQGCSGEGAPKPGYPNPAPPRADPSPETQAAKPADETNLRPAEPPGNGPLHTVAALGDPARPGLWLETPLVRTQTPGRIVLAASGTGTQVTLIPIAGVSTGGSRLSLAAMQALGVPLGDLIELNVYPGS